MKHNLLFILLILPQVVFAQRIKYNLMVADSCSDKVENELLYEIIQGDKKYGIEDTLGTIFLPDTGTYVLIPNIPDLYSLSSDSLILKLTEYKTYSDTLVLKRIVECVGGLHSGFYGFCGCDLEELNGYQADFYPDGQKRMEGIFKNGYAIGQVIYYYPSGRKKEVRNYDMKGEGRLLEKILYDKKGNTVEIK